MSLEVENFAMQNDARLNKEENNRSQSVVDLLNSEQEFTLSRLRVENGKWITQVKIGGRTTSGFDAESAVRGAFSYEK